MTDYNFQAKTRTSDLNKIREEGFVPAIIYGKDFDNKNLQVDKVMFARLHKEAGGSNIVDLNIDEKDQEKVLIQDVQVDPVTNDIVHVDFYKVDMKQKIKTDIPLEFTGESILVVEQEGSFITSKSEVSVECLPTDLVDHIKIEISGLIEFDQNIKVADIKAPSGIEILEDPEELVAMIQPPRSEEELDALEEEVVEDIEAIEVEEKGKDDEEGEEGEDSAEGEEGENKEKSGKSDEAKGGKKEGAREEKKPKKDK